MMERIDSNNMTRELKNLLEEYELYIYTFNDAIQKEYSLSISPLIASRQRVIPSKGFIMIDGNKFDYFFHGSGCSLIIDNVSVDFDYDLVKDGLGNNDWIYKQFSAYQLWGFIKSKEKSNMQLCDEKIFSENIKLLEVEGYIKKVNPDKEYSDWIKCN